MNDYYYVNEGGTIRSVASVTEWAAWYESDFPMKSFDDGGRRVAEDHVGGYRVSTVFLSTNHSFGFGSPELFETMVFEGSMSDLYRLRYATWQEAVQGHRSTVAAIESGEPPWVE